MASKCYSTRCCWWLDTINQLLLLIFLSLNSRFHHENNNKLHSFAAIKKQVKNQQLWVVNRLKNKKKIIFLNKKTTFLYFLLCLYWIKLINFFVLLRIANNQKKWKKIVKGNCRLNDVDLIETLFTHLSNKKNFFFSIYNNIVKSWRVKGKII